jgi:hypothetical protein
MTTTITGATGVNQITDDAITAAKLPAGSVLQVKYAQSSANVTVSTSGTYVDVITLNFTPLSATSKMMVEFAAVYYKQGTTTSNAKFKILRDSTPASIEPWATASNTAHYLNYGDTNHHNLILPISYTVFDQPLSTSTVTYKFAVANAGPDLAFYAGVKLIVQEIAQ